MSLRLNRVESAQQKRRRSGKRKCLYFLFPYTYRQKERNSFLEDSRRRLQQRAPIEEQECAYIGEPRVSFDYQTHVEAFLALAQNQIRIFGMGLEIRGDKRAHHINFHVLLSCPIESSLCKG